MEECMELLQRLFNEYEIAQSHEADSFIEFEEAWIIEQLMRSAGSGKKECKFRFSEIADFLPRMPNQHTFRSCIDKFCQKFDLKMIDRERPLGPKTYLADDIIVSGWLRNGAEADTIE